VSPCDYFYSHIKAQRTQRVLYLCFPYFFACSVSLCDFSFSHTKTQRHYVYSLRLRVPCETSFSLTQRHKDHKDFLYFCFFISSCPLCLRVIILFLTQNYKTTDNFHIFVFYISLCPSCLRVSIFLWAVDASLNSPL
jgi:hypothetical protein